MKKVLQFVFCLTWTLVVIAFFFFKSSVFLLVAGDQTVTFSEVVLEVMRHLEGAYALIFKSRHYPNELIACKRGSPLLLGVKVSSCLQILHAKYVSFLLIK